jgi:hypothetical protein
MPVPAITRYSYSTNSVIWSAALCVPATCTVPMAGMVCFARCQGKVSRIYFRANAAFAMPEVYEFLETEQIKYAMHEPLHLSDPNWLIALVDAQRVGE